LIIWIRERRFYSLPVNTLNNRLLNGFNYFWDLKPSDIKTREQGMKLVMVIHEWQKLFKNGERPTEIDLYEIAKKIFDPKD
jgi:hypothetical protein